MIVGIGIDSVEVQRFTQWHTRYSHKQLCRFFSEQEVAYCLEYPAKSAERLAIRFAAKEAFYKAFCAKLNNANISFLQVAPLIQLTYVSNRPALVVEWQTLLGFIPAVNVHLSCTHTNLLATAFVIVEQVSNNSHNC